MLKKTLLTLLLMAAVSHAAVKELIPNLQSDDLKVQTQARLDLLAACSVASAPDAENGAREAVCLEICDVLEGNYPTVEVIQPMLNNLERIGGEESVPTLAKLMNHKDEHIRDDARRALAENLSNAAAQVLGAQLKSRKARSAKTTAGLITALGERQQEGASRLIVGALNSPNQDVFIAAVKALGQLNEEDGVQALMQKRNDEQGFRKMEINAALLSTGREGVLLDVYTSSEDSEVKATALLGLILGGDTSQVAAAMASGDAVLQVTVIEAAVQSGEKVLYDVIAENMETLAPQVQLQALGALEFSGNRDYAKALEAVLTSSNWFTQVTAAKALARIGSVDSVSVLIANGSVDARRALGQLNVDGVDAELEKIAASSADVNRRAAAIEALANRGRRDLIPTFLIYAGSDDKTVSAAALKAVGSIGGLDQIDALVNLMIAQENSPVARDALNAMVAIMRRSTSPEDAVEILVSKMNEASPRSRVNILQALVQSGSTEALKPIVEGCQSPDEKLQKQAIKLLGGWKQMNGIPVMLDLASDESISLANHVTLMRGVSRLYAAEKPWKLKKTDVQKAIDTCRRPEEKEALQATLKKAN